MGTPPPNRSPARRFARVALRAAAFLLAGAVVSVGVAWGLALWITPPGGTWTAATVEARALKPVTGVTGWSSERMTLDELPWDLFNIPEGAYIYRASWKGLGQRYAVYHLGPQRAHYYSSGWPLPAMSAHLRIGSQATHGWRSGWEPPQWLRTSEFNVARLPSQLPPLPLNPQLGALSVNAVVWAVVLTVPWFAAGALRRALRRRRNLCPSCGYSREGLGDQACPECGSEPNVR